MISDAMRYFYRIARFTVPLFMCGCIKGNGGVAASTAAAEPAEVTVNGRKADGAVSFSTKHAAFFGTTSNQYYEFGREYDSDDPTYLVIHNGLPYASVTSFGEPQVTETYVYSASFEIVAIESKTKDHYYIAGRDGADDLVERWKRSTVSIIGGGTSYVMKRTQLYRGQLGGIRSIAVDHLARFVLIVHGSDPTSISKLSLPNGGVPTVLYSEVQIPELSSVVDSVFPRKHTTYGIVWTIQNRAPTGGVRKSVLLLDNQDDGVIDSWSVVDEPAYSSDYSASSDLWEDWFLTD